jgi:hypothetical protein
LRITELQVKTKAGLALLAIGTGILAAWNWWSGTRNLDPVNMPVPLAAGQNITSEFKLNFDGLYLIEIEADKAIPPDTLHCLMGVEADPLQCKSMPSVVAATWVLSREGHDIGQGSSVQPHSAPPRTDGVARVIGEFQGEAGKSYRLSVTFAEDAGPLAVAHPRLKVAVASIAYTDLQSAKALAFSAAFMSLLCGLILLLVAYFVSGKKADPSLRSG